MNRRIEDEETLKREVAREIERMTNHQLEILYTDARDKLRRIYPSVSD